MTALYYYTLIIMAISLLSSSMGLCIYLVTRRRYGLCVLTGFGFYFFDVALIFHNDFLRIGNPAERGSPFDIHWPIASLLLGAGVLASFWLLVLDYLEWSPRWVLIPIVAQVGGSLVALTLVPPGRWHEFAFFGVRDATMLALVVTVMIHYLRAGPDERTLLRRHRSFFIAASILVVGTIAWNVYFQIMRDYSNLDPASLTFLPERNFAENALLVVCAFYASRYAISALRLRYDQTPTYSAEDRRRRFIADGIEAFGRRFDLSPREREVLRHLVDGQSNQEIATDLFLAPSTVKVHVHHILAKTKDANRIELVKHFWSGM